MKRTLASVLIGGLGLTAFAAGWWIRQPRVVKEGGGPVQPLGVSVGAEVPARFGRWWGLTTHGSSPVRLFFRLPGLGRIATAQQYDWGRRSTPPPNRVAARIQLPNGSTAPVDIQSTEDRLLVDLRADIPPSLNRFTVEIDVPGQPASRFRVLNAGTGTIAFDVDRRVTSQGKVTGEAWWQPQEEGSPAPALFSRLKVADFRPRAGEVGELHFETVGPFAEPGQKPWVRFGSSVELNDRNAGTAEWITTPFAGYAKALHSNGAVCRYRVFDETVDFGTAALRPRQRQHGSPLDAAPVLDAPRTATTSGGLHLTIPNRSLEDNSEYAMGMTVCVPFDVDRSSVKRGLPSDMARLARTHPVEVSIKPVSRKEDWFTGLDYEPRLREPNVFYPRYVTFSDVAKGRITTFPLRFRVRRRVLVEATPFDLTVPVSGPKHLVKYRRGMGDGAF